MKKAFTFAELMISLVVISVITAILYPTIADLGINENKALFKSAYRSMSLALSEVINDTEDGILPDNLCEKMAKKLNVQADKCTGGGADGTLTTTNGMRWYISTNTGCSTDPTGETKLAIDVASSNNTMTNSGTVFGSFGDSGAYGDGTGSKKQDTFTFTITCDGRIKGMDDVGYKHLSDSGSN